MSETAQDKVNRILRDHEGYTGDGKGGDGALPVGDRSTAVKPIVKRDLREAMTETLGDSYEARDIAVDAAQRAEAAALGVEYPVSYAPGQGLNPTQQGDARDNLGLGTAATVDHGTDPGEVPLNSDLGSMAVEDADDYVTKASKATQAQAEGGVTGDVWMDDVRVRQAVSAQRPLEYYYITGLAGSGNKSVISSLLDVYDIQISLSGMASTGSYLFFRPYGSLSGWGTPSSISVTDAGGTGLIASGAPTNWLRWDIQSQQTLRLTRSGRSASWYFEMGDRFDGKRASARIVMSGGAGDIMTGISISPVSGQTFTDGHFTVLFRGVPT